VNLSDPRALAELAAEFGIDPRQAEAVWSDPAWKARLKQANDAAIAAGVFGAPFFMVDGEPFWGNDRRPQIERWLEGGPF
jgi:2-hydroxychromene-2-carboxylate isomerase